MSEPLYWIPTCDVRSETLPQAKAREFLNTHGQRGHFITQDDLRLNYGSQATTLPIKALPQRIWGGSPPKQGGPFEWIAPYRSDDETAIKEMAQDTPITRWILTRTQEQNLSQFFHAVTRIVAIFPQSLLWLDWTTVQWDAIQFLLLHFPTLQIEGIPDDRLYPFKCFAHDINRELWLADFSTHPAIPLLPPPIYAIG